MREQTTFHSELKIGQRVNYTTRASWGEATGSGIYLGVALDEEDRVPYHYFVDGEINGHPQGSHGFPAAPDTPTTTDLTPTQLIRQAQRPQTLVLVVRTVFADDEPDLVENVPAARAERWAAATRKDFPRATVTVELAAQLGLALTPPSPDGGIVEAMLVEEAAADDTELASLAQQVADALARAPKWEDDAFSVRDEFDALVDAALGHTLPRDEQGCCACGSTAGDEFHCADCGAEV